MLAVIATMLVSAGVLAPRPALQSAVARDPFQQLVSVSTDRGPLARGTSLGMMLELRNPHLGGDSISAPGGTVLTPQQYQAAHGAFAADVAMVLGFAP
jgi:hypothetical protein